MSARRHIDRRTFLKTLGIAAASAMLPIGCDRMHTLAPSHPGNPSVKGASAPSVLAATKDFTPAFGIIPPMILPMFSDLSIDYDGLMTVIDWHVEQGITAVFLASGSGEYYQLTEDEIVEIATRTVAHVGGAIPVLCGATNHLSYSKDAFYARFNSGDLNGDEALYDQDVLDNIDMAKRVEDAGVDGIFITIPMAVPYEKFTDWTQTDWRAAHSNRDLADPGYARLRADLDDIIVDYYTQVHDAVACTVWGYEMPGNVAGYKFSADGFANLGALDRTIGLKDTTISVDAIAAKVVAANGTIQVLDANVDNLYDSLGVGASGAINTTSNVASGLFSREIELYRQGRTTYARSLHSRIQVVDDYLMDHGEYPRNAKQALKMMNLPIQSFTRRSANAVNISRMREMIEYIRDTRAIFDAVTPTGIAAG